MRRFLVTLLILSAVISGRGENMELRSGLILTNAEVLFNNPNDLFVSYSVHGKRVSRNVPLAEVPPDLQAKYGYSEAAAEKFKAEQAQREAEHNQRRAEAERQQRKSAPPPVPGKRPKESAVTHQPPDNVQSQDWQVVESVHFFIYHKDSAQFAGKVSTYLEEIFVKMMKRMDVIKGLDVTWTGVNRIKIYVYNSQREMVDERQLPEWAGGAASYHTKTIYMVNREEVLKDVVSHELGHQVFFDLMEGKPLPAWIAEGVAQWLEPEESRKANQKRLAAMKQKGILFSLKDLTSTTDTKPIRGEKIEIFYCQSMSLVSLLIDTSGFEIFKLFCIQLRNGSSFENAFNVLYSPKFATIDDLEKAWKASL